MSLLVIILHVVVCIALIMIVLLQTGKGADMGAAFGGGASQTLFGTTGASTFLSKATTAAAIIFMLTSLVLAYMASDRPSGSLMPDNPASLEQEEQPAGEEDTPAATSQSGESEDSAADVQPGTTEEQPTEPAPATPTETQDKQQDNQQ